MDPIPLVEISILCLPYSLSWEGWGYWHQEMPVLIKAFICKPSLQFVWDEEYSSPRKLPEGSPEHRGGGQELWPLFFGAFSFLSLPYCGQWQLCTPGQERNLGGGIDIPEL